jgi:hypothetical protein
LQAFRIGAAVGFELCLDPVQRIAVALRALAAVAERGQALDGGLVLVQLQLLDQHRDGIGRRGFLRQNQWGGQRQGQGCAQTCNCFQGSSLLLKVPGHCA